MQFLKQDLSNQFKLCDLGVSKQFLGLEIARSRTWINLSQCKLQWKFCLIQVFLVASLQRHLWSPTLVRLSSMVSCYQIQHIIFDSLVPPLHLSYVVNKFNQFVLAPRTTQLRAVHQVLQYIIDIIGRVSFFPSNSELQLKAFVDSDWAAYLILREPQVDFVYFGIVTDFLAIAKAIKRVLLDS